MKFPSIGKPVHFTVACIGVLLAIIYIIMLCKYLSLESPALSGWSVEGDGMKYCIAVNKWAAKRSVPWTVTGWITFVFAAVTLSIGSLFGVNTSNGEAWPKRFPGPIITTTGVVLAVITLYSLSLADAHNRIAADAYRAQKNDVSDDRVRYDMCMESMANMFEEMIQSNEIARASTKRLLDKQEGAGSIAVSPPTVTAEVNEKVWKQQSELLENVEERLQQIELESGQTEQVALDEVKATLEQAKQQAYVHLATTQAETILTEKESIERQLKKKEQQAQKLRQTTSSDEDVKKISAQQMTTLETEIKVLKSSLQQKDSHLDTLEKEANKSIERSKEARTQFCLGDRRASTTTRKDLADEPKTLKKVEDACQTAPKKKGESSGVDREAWQAGEIRRANGDTYKYWCSCRVQTDAITQTVRIDFQK